MAPQGTQGSGFMDLGGGGPNLRRPSPGARRSANIYALRAFAVRSANKGALGSSNIDAYSKATSQHLKRRLTLIDGILILLKFILPS